MCEKFQMIVSDIMTFWINKVTTEEVLESYTSKILETVQKHLDDWCLIQTILFIQRTLIRPFIQSFKQFRGNFQTSKVLAHKRKWYKIRTRIEV